MKKLITVAAVLALLVSVCVQAKSYDEITKEVKVWNFAGIRAGNRFEVDVEKSQYCALELTFPSELEEYVIAEVKSGELILTINMEKAPRNIRREFNNGDWKLYAKVSCPEIERIRLSGAASMLLRDKFETSYLDIRTSGASSLNAAFRAVKGLKIKASGASHIEMELSGNIDISDIKCSGASNLYVMGGDYNACVVDNSGASDIDMEEVSMENLRVSLSGASTFYADGTADILDVNVSGASSFKAPSLIVKEARVEASGVSEVSLHAEEVYIDKQSKTSTFRNRPQ